MYGPFIYTVQYTVYIHGGLVLSTEWVVAKSVGIKREWARGRKEEACTWRYNRYFSYQFPLPFIRTILSPFSICPSIRPSVHIANTYTTQPIIVPDATVSDGASLLLMYRNAGKKVLRDFVALSVLWRDRRDRNRQWGARRSARLIVPRFLVIPLYNREKRFERDTRNWRS